jgi:hypothetical protein
MKHDVRTITFREREFKGSRLRCLLLTSQSDTEVAGVLTSLVTPHASVTPEDRWAPRGLREPDEGKLGETPGFLPKANRDALTRWWLAKSGRANTPNWDLVSTCRINDRAGLVLVEAKAHEAELGDDRCGAVDTDNIDRIDLALAEAMAGWNAMMPGFVLSAKTHYQLSNRFAFAWKLATMGVPVVLVYLGFLDAGEMESGNRVVLKNQAQWRDCVLDRSKGTIPQAAWGRTFDVDGTPVTVLIRSAVVAIDVRLLAACSSASTAAASRTSSKPSA